MIQKWKTILSNWINCYTTEDEKIQQNITTETLLNIFTHIHENFKLDDSKSSKFEAHTIQDFIVEKYPEFKFENGPDFFSEDEVCMAASLLLFFICVNSKNEDVKRVMCSKLNAGDQETILKFSKCLMECSPVLYADVTAAISEACGQDVPTNQVAETPPPLRSLHGEVRRLQAALDAERFDRNYLQEELVRTNLKLDKLTKDKEQYKLEILNLKAKISLCCGEQREDRGEARADDSRLQRQLQDLEQRLVDTQGRLDDALHERDAYKKKVEDLKQERDKWLSVSQEEAYRAGQLSDQLDIERRTVQSLKDLVSELRQHNRNNGLDASLLECDDPDTSIQSLQNLSVCSEACANVVEVQLGEERAKVLVLKQQVQELQDQLSQANKKFESEKLYLENIITEKNEHATDLEHRIQSEIEVGTNLKCNYDQEVSKLNAKITELVQKIKNNEESSKLALDEKIHEMELLQKHLAEESKKSGNIIKNLKIELEAEKYAQLKLRDEFDDRIMKLNEKVLNRNNELVELQNNIIQKSEMIEVIQSDLRREKELRDELSNSCNNQLFKLNDQRIKIENDIQEKTHEIADYQKQIQEKDSRIDRLNKDVDKLHSTITSLEDKCQHRESKIIEKQKEIEFLNDVFQKEQEKLTHKADERYATIKSLQMQLQNEIEYKVQLQNQLTELEASKTSLIKKVNEVKCKSEGDLVEKQNMLDAMEKQIQTEKKNNEHLQQDIEKMNDKLTEQNTNNMLLKVQLEKETKSFEEKITKKDDVIESIKKKLSTVLKEKADLQESLKRLGNENTSLVAASNEKVTEHTKLKTAYEKLCRDHHENKQNLRAMDANLKEEIKKNELLQDSNEKDTSKLLLKLEKTEKSIKKIQVQSKSILDSKELHIQTLKMEIASLQHTIESEREELNLHKKEKEVLEQNLREEIFFKNRLEAEYQKKCKMLEDITCRLQEEISLKKQEIQKLRQATVKLENDIKEFETKVESENAVKIEMKEEYEKHVLELSEKELRCNKVLAEKAAEIDHILLNLKNEKELKDKLSNDLTQISDQKRQIEESFRLKAHENEELQNKVEHNFVIVQDMQKEVADMKSFAGKLEQECFSLKETNDELLKEAQIHSFQLDENRIQLEETIEKITEEKEQLRKTLSEKDTILESLERQVQFELELKRQVEQKYIESDSNHREQISKLDQEITDLNVQLTQRYNEITLIKPQLQEKIINIESLNTEIEGIRHNISVLTKQLSESENKNAQMIEESRNRDNLINALKNKVQDLENNLTTEKNNANFSVEKAKSISAKLENEVQDKLKLLIEMSKIETKNTELNEANQNLMQKVSEMICLLEEKDTLIKNVNEQLRVEIDKSKELIRNCDIKDTELRSTNEQLVLKNKELLILNNELKHAVESKHNEVLEKDNILDDIKNILESESIEKETLQSSIKDLNELNSNLMDDVKKYQKEFEDLKVNYENLCKTTQDKEIAHQSDKNSIHSILSEKEDELLNVKNSLASEMDHKTRLTADYDSKINTLTLSLEELKRKLNDQETNSKLMIDLKDQEVQSLENELAGEKTTFENTLKVLEIEVDAEKISKLKMKDDFENHVSKLNKKINNMSKELLELQNSVIDNNQKTELLLTELNKEKESSKCMEMEILKLNENKNLFENDLQLKLEEFEFLKERLDEKVVSIEQLNKEIDDLRTYCTNLQKDKRILEEAKTALLTVIEERDKKIADYVKGELVLTVLVNNLELLMKEITNQMEKQDDVTEITPSKLRKETENTTLKNNLGSLNAEHVKASDICENMSEMTQLTAENEKLLHITQETERIIKRLEAKLHENSLRVRELKNSVDAEKSKIVHEVNEMQSIIKKKDLEIQNLNNAQRKLENDLTRYRESLVSAQKENELLETRISNEVLLKNKFVKECENLRVMLNGITEKLNENVVSQNNEATNMAKEIQMLRKTVEQKCEELKIAEENVLKRTQAIADLTDANGAEISSLKERVASLQSFNDELEQELKNEADKNMQVIEALQKDNEQLQFIIEEDNSGHESKLKEKNDLIEALDEKLKNATRQIESISKDYENKTLGWEKLQVELEEKIQAQILKITNMEEEKEILVKEIGALKEGRKGISLEAQEKALHAKYTSLEKDMQGSHHQVDTTTSDLTHSSMDSLKTISDLEKIVQDKNRKITSLQTEMTYIKSMVAQTGVKHIDVSKELEASRETCEELAAQLRKLAQQKNEEIAELKRQVLKMSATETRASQIIKVSAKYQAMILKRIAEIKSTAVLKELTNYGNANNGDEPRRSFAGSITMEDLENFLETTDRHLKRCSERQLALQKDRDRLTEVNRINESEIINMKKFLTETSVSFRTFSTVKEVYCQKLAKIVSLQRTARRDILGLEGRVTEAAACRLERGYAAAVQDLAECAMNLERWVERSVSRLLSPEKIKQAFTSDAELTALATANYQNAAVEVQLNELENSFQKLLEETARAGRGDGARAAQDVTVMEVRAEYEDKLNRMKAKMKELFHDEMGRLKQKQSEEIAVLERELIKSREKLAESSRAYEEHIRALTTELWSVGEKFLVKQEEADWLRRKQSGSLMSLQHVHSAGLHGSHEVMGRPSDTLSLRSLPVHGKKTENRGMHMSDEEGEVFDNRFLKELSATPRASLAPGQRISELKRRNSLVPPHLKSSYPTELQFATIVDEEDIKCVSNTNFATGRQQRKEVGITAYKKPGPPTPSKQAGRLSATDSELRESLRVEADPQASRKTSTPSRLRSLFRSHRAEGDEGTPRSRRFSNIFRKK